MAVRLREQVALAESAEGAVLLDERNGRYWRLNRSGALVLRALLAGHPLHQAATELSAAYLVDPERADTEADAGELLQRLHETGLVTG